MFGLELDYWRLIDPKEKDKKYIMDPILKEIKQQGLNEIVIGSEMQNSLLRRLKGIKKGMKNFKKKIESKKQDE